MDLSKRRKHICVYAHTHTHTTCLFTIYALGMKQPFWSTGTVPCTETGGPEFEPRTSVGHETVNCCALRTAYRRVANATAS